MRQIHPHSFWLSHARDAENFRALFDLGIAAIVQLATEEPPLKPPRELICCRFPLVDGPGNEPVVLSLAIATLASLLEKKCPTLVCCGAGLSRSPAIAAAALSVVCQLSPDDCLKQVAEYHPADVAPGLWQEVKKIMESLTRPSRKQGRSRKHEEM